ncbi:MAG TPA: DUF2795 domain-containing protein [Galbitalea sp.]|jgi:hypothetical protein
MDFSKPFGSLLHQAHLWAEKVNDSLDTVQDRRVVAPRPSSLDTPDPLLVLIEARYPTTRNDIVAFAIANGLDAATIDALLQLPADRPITPAAVRYQLANF